MQKYATIEKHVGETPLEAAERLRKDLGLSTGVPLAYAGRLDPMASGTLLILIGDECKKQTDYHSLDKEYQFEVLFGISSDTGDVLGMVEERLAQHLSEAEVLRVTSKLNGPIELPYPHFSSKTVAGKPLHTWTLEGRLGEIEIPTKKSQIYNLMLKALRTVSREEACEKALKKIETIPPVTDERKKLGRDFRRTEVRAAWKEIKHKETPSDFQIATLTCVCSSGTYMRSLAGLLAESLGTTGLAYSIHRSKIGIYKPLIRNIGLWTKKF